MFFKKMKSRLLSLLRKTLIWILSQKTVQIVVLKVLPKIRFSTSYALLGWADYTSISLNARPGDIILSVDKSKLTSLLIPGYWSHVGLVVKNDHDQDGVLIVEAVPPAVRETSLFDFCKCADEVMVLRPDVTNDVVEQAVFRAKYNIGREYDGLFKYGPTALYCAELISYCFLQSVKFDWSDLWGVGYPYLSPDGVADGEPLTVIFHSRHV